MHLLTEVVAWSSIVVTNMSRCEARVDTNLQNN